MITSRGLRLLLVAGATLLLLAGCATPRQTLSLRHSPPAVAPQIELEAVPFFPQERFQCGPAALATVLVDQGVDVSPEQLEPEVYLPERHGSVQIELVAAARRRGRLVYPLEAPQLSNLIHEIAAGHPVLVMQNLGLDWLPQWHYAVAVGYDLEHETVTLRSATVKQRVSSLAVFERTWSRAGYWGLVIVPPHQIPQTATPLAFIRAAHDLESVGKVMEAARAYRSAAQHWPDEYAAGLALGNLEYRRDDYLAAESVFRDSLQSHPEHPVIWNNLAYTLASRQCVAEAVAAVLCAHRLAPHDENIVYSVREITEWSVDRSPPASGCDPLQCPVN